MHIYEKFGVRPLINGRSFSTKGPGAALPQEVLDAMQQAGECCVRMDELQDAASRVIARATSKVLRKIHQMTVVNPARMLDIAEEPTAPEAYAEARQDRT
jgi:hypothetical protein